MLLLQELTRLVKALVQCGSTTCGVDSLTELWISAGTMDYGRTGVHTHVMQPSYAKVIGVGCTKTRNGEIRNGKWGNAEMRKWGMENKSVAARGSAVSEAVAEAEDW